LGHCLGGIEPVAYSYLNQTRTLQHSGNDYRSKRVLWLLLSLVDTGATPEIMELGTNMTPGIILLFRFSPAVWHGKIGEGTLASGLPRASMLIPAKSGQAFCSKH